MGAVDDAHSALCDLLLDFVVVWKLGFGRTRWIEGEGWGLTSFGLPTRTGFEEALGALRGDGRSTERLIASDAGAARRRLGHGLFRDGGEKEVEFVFDFGGVGDGVTDAFTQ